MPELVPTTSDIIGALANAKAPDAMSIALAFRDAAKVGKPEVWELLSRIFEMMLHASDLNEPLGPVLITDDGRRSMIPTDATDEQLLALRPLLSALDHTGFRARLGDVLWLRERNAAAAQLAVIAYKQTGIALEATDTWHDAAKQYERGLRLARQLNRNGVELRETLDHLQQRVRDCAPDRDRLRNDLLALLHEFRDGDPAELGAIAMETGDRLRTKGIPIMARHSYDIAAKFFHRVGDNLKADAARIAKAETYVQEADGFGSGMSQLAAHGALQNAILAFQKIPSCRDRIPDLQRRLRAAGQEVLNSMQSIEIPMEVTELIERARTLISGTTFEEAVFKLAFITSLNDPDTLRSQVTSILADSPLHAMFNTTVLDAAGRTTGVAPGALSGNAEEHENGMRHEMHRHAGLNRSLACGGYIIPSLRIINDEHVVEEADVAKFITDHPLIPKAHEPYFIRGITYGLKGDFPAALLFLVPQIENSLRLVLHDAGVITSDLNRDGIELEWTLRKLLSHPALAEILGKAMVFELSDLLLGDSFGSNFRNTLTHGLISYSGASTQDAAYLWWVLLRFIILSSPQFQSFAERHRPTS